MAYAQCGTVLPPQNPHHIFGDPAPTLAWQPPCKRPPTVLPVTRIFLDTEFTGLHQRTTLISLAMVAESGEEFYAEFTDYDSSQLFPWLQEHVMPKLWLQNKLDFDRRPGGVYLRGDRDTIRKALEAWLKPFELIEVWADVLAYDWVLFCELFGGALYLPANVFYAPFDLATLFRLKNEITPTCKYQKDLNRFAFAGVSDQWQHNALMDARVESTCTFKLLTA